MHADPTKAKASVVGEVQPFPGPIDSVYSRIDTPDADSTRPARSSRPGSSWRDSCSQTIDSATVAMPTGTLIRKIHRHDAWSTSRPPSIGPIAGAMTVTLSTPIAAFARSAIGNAR